MSDILPGSRVMAFDRRLYENDVKTPLSMTIKPATVVCRYGYKFIYTGNIVYDDLGNKYGESEEWLYPDLVDLIFDHHPDEIYKGKFTYGVKLIGEENEI